MVRFCKINAFLPLPVGVKLLAVVGSFLKLPTKFCCIRKANVWIPLVWAVGTRFPQLLKTGRWWTCQRVFTQLLCKEPWGLWGPCPEGYAGLSSAWKYCNSAKIVGKRLL